MQPLLNIAIQAARRAGEIIVRGMNRVHRLEVRAKGQNDFVTEIDTAAERDIIETVRRRYPQHAFLAEESGQSGSEEEEGVIAAIADHGDLQKWFGARVQMHRRGEPALKSLSRYEESLNTPPVAAPTRGQTLR